MSIVQVQVTNIQPKENVVYTKQTQTTSTGTHHERDGEHQLHVHINLLCFVFLTISKRSFCISKTPHIYLVHSKEF